MRTSIRSKRSRPLAAVCAASLAAALAASGAVPASEGSDGPFPNLVIFVGNGVTCDYDTVQEAIDAAAVRPGEDTIAIARDRSYGAQALVIADPDGVTLRGGFATCLGVEDAVRTVLDGSGGVAAPVIRHSGAGNLTLQRLHITGGDAINAGGGVDALGTGFLRLQDVEFVANRGVGGGGVAAASGSPLQTKAVYLVGDVDFIDNSADAGGGMFLMNGTVFPLFEPRLRVIDNVATAGDGGGWYLLNATVRPNVPGEGFGCPLTFALNRASDRGGGLFVHARGGQSNVELRPARDCAGGFLANTAGREGGAVHGFADASLDAPLASASRIDIRLQAQQLVQNVAPDGAALMLRSTRTGSRQASAFLQFAPGRYAGDIDSLCNSSAFGVCPTIEQNRAESAPGVPDRAAITVIDDGDGGSPTTLQIANAALAGNFASQQVRVFGPEAQFGLFDSLLTGTGGDRVLDADAGARALIVRSTLVHAGVEADAVLLGDREFLLEGSIAIVPGREILRLRDPDNVAEVRDLMTDHLAVLAPGNYPPAVVGGTFAVADPRFVDPVAGNFRLRADSAAIDRHEILDVDQLGARDLDLRPRGLDDAAVANPPGRVWDLGAYERSDRVFVDGFEDPDALRGRRADAAGR